jgi:hypothetical protein
MILLFCENYPLAKAFGQLLCSNTEWEQLKESKTAPLALPW